MPQVELEICGTDRPQEDARLAALISTGILDTPPEPSYDTITTSGRRVFPGRFGLYRICRREPRLDEVLWRQKVRELPRKNSIFDMVLAEDGPVVISDISKHPQSDIADCRASSIWAWLPLPAFPCAPTTGRFSEF